MRRKLVILVLLSFYFCLLSSQVRIRIFADNNPDYLFFKVISGKYLVSAYTSDTITVSAGETVLLARYSNRIAVKARRLDGFASDSIYIRAGGNNARFLLATDDKKVNGRIYSGDLQCIADMGAILLINICEIESYVAGVVRAEGGNGKKAEYFRTQSIIARTYTYKSFRKHQLDRYNLCDCTHCQVFSGVTGDSLIIKAALDTRDMVIVTPDSSLIIAAFHSNCGGETSPSEYAWSAKKPYLVRVADPYCLKSRNSTWNKLIPVNAWSSVLSRNGYSGRVDSASLFDFNMPARVQDYTTGSFTIPFNVMRNELGLKSAWFSVKAEGDSIRLTGKGYGHGIGLCQEGAMVMASQGIGYHDIISFYYPGVRIMNISDAKKDNEDNPAGKN